MKSISSGLKLAAAVLVWTFALPALPILPAPAATSLEEVKISSAGKACLACHKSMNPGLVAQWQGSAHAGVGVDCYSCHQAHEGDSATWPRTAASDA